MAEQHVREIRQATRKRYSAEEKIRIVLSGLRGEHSIALLCRRERIAKELVADLTLKNRILLEHYFLPGNLERQIAALVDRYNHRRYHESLKNLIPADVYLGRGTSILQRRELRGLRVYDDQEPRRRSQSR